MPTVPSPIVCHSISKTFGELQVFRDLSFEIAAGSFVSILGPSGSGKTTLLRVLADLEAPTAGSVERSTATISYVFQEAHLLPWRNALANVELPLEFLKVSPSERRRAAEAALAMVGLSSAARRRPHELSGGMKMRVSLARALATQPDLLFLDEPFAALDEIQRMQLEEELHALWARLRMTVVLVTHSVSEAVFLSQRILYLCEEKNHFGWDERFDWPSPRSRELRAEPAFVQRLSSIQKKIETSSQRSL